MEISNLSDAEFKTLVIWMLKELRKELSEDLNSIKKIQSDMKDTLIEIKSNLQENNSRVDEAEKSMIWNIKKQSEQEGKRIQRNEDSVSSL